MSWHLVEGPPPSMEFRSWGKVKAKITISGAGWRVTVWTSNGTSSKTGADSQVLAAWAEAKLSWAAPC